MIGFSEVKSSEEIKTYVTLADESLGALGYTEHSFAHAEIVSRLSGEILLSVGMDERAAELGRIAGYLHDIGNLINREQHSECGAIMAFGLLRGMGFDPKEVGRVVRAIANHDEGRGAPVDAISAALILADKSDVRRSRVRNFNDRPFDIHDRVNYSVVDSALKICGGDKTARLDITIDTSISSIMDYFQIFLDRMALCRRAAERLGLTFKLGINGQSII